jgi:ribonuclease G
MSKELVIGSNRHETKVAVLEDDQLVELYFQRANEYSLAGSIHKGRVTRVLPGMQSAFVDLGLERDTFLYVSDFFEENEDIDVAEEKPRANERRERVSRANGDGTDRGLVSEDRSTEVREVRSPKVDEAPPPEALEEVTVESTASGPTSAAELGAEKLLEKTAGERGFRGRGRRSRRRRQRGGRGFPETKYAQPSTGETTLRDEPASEAPEEEEQASDVIILPGESLAKYRRMTADTGEPEEDSTEALSGGIEEESAASAADDDLPGSKGKGQAPGEELEAEADEIELTDKVFGHRNDVLEGRQHGAIDKREKIEDVREDHPSIDTAPLEHTVETGPIVSLETAVRETTEETYPGLAEAKQHSAPIIVETAASEAPEGAALEADEFEGADLEDVPEEPSSDGGETGLESSPTATVLETPIAESPSHEGTEAAQAQTASVREQSGRYMHRVSRRMRRRRGGNRFSQQSDMGTPGGAATAPAFEPAERFEARREQRESGEERSSERSERTLPSISDLLKSGQEIIVQIAKEPLGQKGARITSHVALPGRYVVFMPSVNHLGVSRKVSSEEERQRLKRILQTHRIGTTGGFIVRTAGEGISEEEIAADMNFLYTLWLDIRQKAEKKPAPAVLHYDLNVVQRILRDQVTEDYKAIWVDNEEMYESVLTFIQRFQPTLVNRVKMYTRSVPIFDAFNITQELEKALRPKVWLKSGGYIVINQTEALVAIDINTGKYVGKSNRLEDTIVKTNTEAVKEIVRQVRLRDLGGIIVVDFIDMDERKNRQKVMQTLEEAMRADKAPYKILQFNDFGLVAITRKRVKQSLERALCAPCPYCEGAGYVKSVQTIIGEILVEAQKLARAIEGKDVVLRVHPDVAKILKASSNRYLEELEEILGRPVLVTGDLALHHEKFDLA